VSAKKPDGSRVSASLRAHIHMAVKFSALVPISSVPQYSQDRRPAEWAPRETLRHDLHRAHHTHSLRVHVCVCVFARASVRERERAGRQQPGIRKTEMRHTQKRGSNVKQK
jgi:hypothetical protein